MYSSPPSGNWPKFLLFDQITTLCPHTPHSQRFTLIGVLAMQCKISIPVQAGGHVDHLWGHQGHILIFFAIFNLTLSYMSSLRSGSLLCWVVDLRPTSCLEHCKIYTCISCIVAKQYLYRLIHLQYNITLDNLTQKKILGLKFKSNENYKCTCTAKGFSLCLTFLPSKHCSHIQSTPKNKITYICCNVYVVVNFSSQVIFIFPLFQLY